jgi:hypothetical protein
MGHTCGHCGAYGEAVSASVRRRLTDPHRPLHVMQGKEDTAPTWWGCGTRLEQVDVELRGYKTTDGLVVTLHREMFATVSTSPIYPGIREFLQLPPTATRLRYVYPRVRLHGVLPAARHDTPEFDWDLNFYRRARSLSLPPLSNQLGRARIPLPQSADLEVPTAESPRTPSVAYEEPGWQDMMEDNTPTKYDLGLQVIVDPEVSMQSSVYSSVLPRSSNRDGAPRDSLSGVHAHVTRAWHTCRLTPLAYHYLGAGDFEVLWGRQWDAVRWG